MTRDDTNLTSTDTTERNAGMLRVPPVAAYLELLELLAEADQPRSCLARRGEPQPVRMGQLGPREQLGDLGVPSSVRPRGPTDRVVGRPPAPQWGAGGVRPSPRRINQSRTERAMTRRCTTQRG